MRLEHKSALILGAGSGIGRAVAVLFAQQGAQVTVVSLDEATLDTTLALIRRDNGMASGVVADVSTEAGIQQAITQATASYGKVDIVFNNVGGGWSDLGKSILDTSAKTYQSCVRCNLETVYAISRQSICQFIRQQTPGCLIHVSAAPGVRDAGVPIYAYTKAGMLELTRHLARDHAQDSIRVNCILPGLIALDAYDGESTQALARTSGMYPKPGERHGHPLDIAYTALFLASDEASFISGECICVDGGESLGFRSF